MIDVIRFFLVNIVVIDFDFVIKQNDFLTSSRIICRGSFRSALFKKRLMSVFVSCIFDLDCSKTILPSTVKKVVKILLTSRTEECYNKGNLAISFIYLYI